MVSRASKVFLSLENTGKDMVAQRKQGIVAAGESIIGVCAKSWRFAVRSPFLGTRRAEHELRQRVRARV